MVLVSKQLKCFIFSDKNKNLRKRTTFLERTKMAHPRAVLSLEVPLYMYIERAKE